MTIYPEYVTFLAKNTFRPGQLLMNHTCEAPSLVPLPKSFFSVSEVIGNRHQRIRSVWIGHYDIGLSRSVHGDSSVS